MSVASPQALKRLPFELADLRLLPTPIAKATSSRFEFLADFLMHAPEAAKPAQKHLLLESIDVLQEIAQ